MSFTPPPGSPRPKPNTGLIVGIVIGVSVLVVCCCFVGFFVAFRPGAAADIIKTILGG